MKSPLSAKSIAAIDAARLGLLTARDAGAG